MALQIFKTFSVVADAHLLKTKLESEGIECYLENEHMSSLYPVQNPSVAGIKLKVFEEDLKKAYSIYDQMEQSKNPEDRSSDQCPGCGSIRITKAERELKPIDKFFTY